MEKIAIKIPKFAKSLCKDCKKKCSDIINIADIVYKNTVVACREFEPERKSSELYLFVYAEKIK